MNGDMKASREVVGARIHAILARESDTAVVFRRGSSNKTAVLKWDLQTDRFDLGQWFYGSFYPYRCDISPGKGHGCYWERHAICDDSGQVVVDGADWSWADYDKPRARVVFASNGAIYSLSCKAPLAKPKKLHDFNGMKYERIKAPY